MTNSPRRLMIALSCAFLTRAVVPAAENASQVEDLASAEAPYLVLCAETNSLRSGLSVVDSTINTIHIRKGKVTTACLFALVNTSTNKVSYVWPKEIERRFEMSMRDSDGSPVAKTTEGKKFGLPLRAVGTNTPAWRQNRYGQGAFIGGRQVWLFNWKSFTDKDASFDLTEDLSRCFDLRKAGRYKLFLAHRIYAIVPGISGFVLKPVLFPPVAVDVEVEM